MGTPGNFTSRMVVYLRTRAVVALLATLVFAHPGAAQDRPIGTLKIVTGTAHVVRADARLPASVGVAIVAADRLETGPDGTIGVTLHDGAMLTLGHNAAFVIREFRFEPERGLLGFVGNALRGAVTYISGRIARLAPDKVRIETPGGEVAVRGTRIAIRVPG